MNDVQPTPKHVRAEFVERELLHGDREEPRFRVLSTNARIMSDLLFRIIFGRLGER